MRRVAKAFLQIVCVSWMATVQCAPVKSDPTLTQAMLEAIRSNDTQRIAALLAEPKLFVDVSFIEPAFGGGTKRTTYLLYAIRWGKVEAVTALLAGSAIQKADPNIATKDYGYPLYLGLTRYPPAPEMVYVLLSYGADARADDSYNGLAISYMPEDAIYKVLQALLNAGARANGKDKKGFAALHRLAIRAGVCNSTEDCPGIIATLRDQGADLNLQGPHSATPLIFGARSSSNSSVIKFVRALQDIAKQTLRIDVPDDCGLRAIDYAKYYCSNGKCALFDYNGGQKWGPWKLELLYYMRGLGALEQPTPNSKSCGY